MTDNRRWLGNVRKQYQTNETNQSVAPAANVPTRLHSSTVLGAVRALRAARALACGDP
jgi:hypothetical protein